MANEHKIEINKRDDITPQGLAQLRREGNIPGIYYSASSKESVPIFITQKNYQEAVKSGSRIFNISVGDKKQNVLFKSVQYHPLTEEIIHIDLYGVNMNKPVVVKVPITLSGDSIGVKEEGGVINQAGLDVDIKCLPGDIPENIEYFILL